MQITFLNSIVLLTWLTVYIIIFIRDDSLCIRIIESWFCSITFYIHEYYLHITRLLSTECGKEKSFLFSTNTYLFLYLFLNLIMRVSIIQIFFVHLPSFSFRPINIILWNWFLSGARDTCAVFFAHPAVERNWLDDWLVVSDRACDRASMEARKSDTTRAIIVPRRAFSFLWEHSNRDTLSFFFVAFRRTRVSGSAWTINRSLYWNRLVSHYSTTPLGILGNNALKIWKTILHPASEIS